MTKTLISVEDIRKGDLIRFEYAEVGTSRSVTAVEYTSSEDAFPYTGRAGHHYLLERPAPPFEPKDGTGITDPGGNEYYSAVRIGGEWLGKVKENDRHWHGSDDWAKQKLAEGWIEIKGSDND